MRARPGRVLGDHAKDEFAQFPVHTSSSRTAPMPREPSPIQLESLPMPADNRLRLDDEERLFPSGPESPQQEPKQPIRRGETRLRMPGSQNGKLLPQGKIFQKKVTARTKRSGEQDEQKPQRARHGSVVAESLRREMKTALPNQSANSAGSSFQGLKIAAPLLAT